MSERIEIWVYWISRDSLRGALKSTCHLWWIKPMRSRVQPRVMWLPTNARDPGYLGEYSIEDIARWFGQERVPETDVMLMKVEQGVTAKMIEEAKRR